MRADLLTISCNPLIRVGNILGALRHMILRFIFSFFGGIFSMLTLGAGMAALSLGAIFYMYGKNLPTYETLANYQPKTISRVYSGEGQVIDEFAEERRLFTPAEEIPDIVKQAFISAEDKNFYTHEGYDIRAIGAALIEAVAAVGPMPPPLPLTDRQADRRTQ